MRLEDYINNFYDEDSRDAVVTQIMKMRVVRDAMATPSGKALLNVMIDRIRDKIISILGACTKQTKTDQTEKIRQDAFEVHIMYNMLKEWAEIILSGEKHEDAMKGNK